MVETVAAQPLASGSAGAAAPQGLEPETALTARVDANLPGGVVRLSTPDTTYDLKVQAPLPQGSQVTVTVSGSKQQPDIQILVGAQAGKGGAGAASSQTAAQSAASSGAASAPAQVAPSSTPAVANGGNLTLSGALVAQTVPDQAVGPPPLSQTVAQTVPQGGSQTGGPPVTVAAGGAVPVAPGILPGPATAAPPASQTPSQAGASAGVPVSSSQSGAAASAPQVNVQSGAVPSAPSASPASGAAHSAVQPQSIGQGQGTGPAGQGAAGVQAGPAGLGQTGGGQVSQTSNPVPSSGRPSGIGGLGPASPPPPGPAATGTATPPAGAPASPAGAANPAATAPAAAPLSAGGAVSGSGQLASGPLDTLPRAAAQAGPAASLSAGAPSGAQIQGTQIQGSQRPGTQMPGLQGAAVQPGTSAQPPTGSPAATQAAGTSAPSGPAAGQGALTTSAGSLFQAMDQSADTQRPVQTQFQIQSRAQPYPPSGNVPTPPANAAGAGAQTPAGQIARQLLQPLAEQQTGLGTLFSQVGTMLSAQSSGKISLPDPVVKAMQQIFGMRLTPGTVPGTVSGPSQGAGVGQGLTEADLQQAVRLSGQFREAQLAALPKGMHPPMGDLKSALLSFKALLQGLGAETDVSRPAHQPAMPSRQGGPQAQAQSQQAASGFWVGAPSENLKALRKETDAALARIRLTQLVNSSLAGDDRPQAAATRAMDLVLELPLALGQETAIMQMQIGRDGGGQDGEGDSEPAWRLRFALDLTATGPLEAAVSLRGGGTYVSLWVDRKETFTSLESVRETMEAAFADAGLDLQEFRLVRGLPPKAAPRHGAMIDRHS